MQTVFIILCVLSLSFTWHCYKQISYDKTSFYFALIISIVLFFVAVTYG